MPHECTNCGRAFADGSKEMLSGCPNCGGNKFQFRPAGVDAGNDPGTDAGAERNATPGETTPTASRGAPDASDADPDASAVGRAASTVKEWVGTRDTTGPGDETASEPERPVSDPDGSAGASESTGSGPEAGPDVEADDLPADEDSAQASARTDVVADDELPERSSAEGAGTVVDAPDDEQPSLEELREELNSQFESIKVVNPGQYELNLMELYERQEYIIALQENGRYVIQVPDSWSDVADT
ncbi:OapC/ArvC family zinc-ribbon domain-containing protein [Halomicrococcus sp. SG-WS-1]|uniref:OapC/ArvC family zinc-ribbon domain-containing protein n=1 Tax=Halomicrococcus sp. SG-WS-1 TaxID=3439057 RepID=UPI003F798167